MFVRHFEPLSYEPLRVHRDHVRLRRSVDQHRRGHVYLRFQGFNRLFNLKLRPDTSVFHKDLVMETQSHGRVKPEINHIYAGELVGEPSSHVYGALLDGVFQGSIQSAHGRYYVEKAQPYFRRRQPFHSVLYDSRDVRYPARTGAGGWCGVTPDTERWMYDVMRRRSPGPQPSHRHIRMASNLRTHIHEYRDRGDRWTGRKPLWEAGAEDEGAEDEQQRVDVPAKNASARMSTRTSRRVCNLKLSVDHMLYGALHDEGSSAPRTRKAITGLVASHVNRASGIFRRTNFGGIQDISFIVHKIVVNDSRSCAEGVKQTNPFCSDAIDAPYLLHLTSRENNDDFCLAYTWTYRDFADGVLGLAWIAKAQLGQGGICEKNRPSVDTKPGTNEYQQYHLSLNTGIITFVNYNSFISFAVSEVTFAHELGHNFGSPEAPRMRPA
ncbi:hypothetical protein HPB48_009822 [Haemaphysalis longicornis]|uniref:Peptidase M12B domain-containing protein n=1 Tax=Haemaphysalis longicornis TaxID=44386 RepID=A0A9J6G2J5_HAELO|nr:hypothetical protein HPB48_009822 [Haemaphysalis longicornis]